MAWWAGRRRVAPCLRARRRRPPLAGRGGGGFPVGRGPPVRRWRGCHSRPGRPNGGGASATAPARAAGRVRPTRRAARARGRRGGCGPPRRAAAVTSRRLPPSPTVRVAAGQGFWGDWLEAPYRQVTGGAIDYLMMDYLAEVTMSILQKQKTRDPTLGYAKDFVPLMERILPLLVERRIKVTANAGGVNPRACADAVAGAARRPGAARKARPRRRAG